MSGFGFIHHCRRKEPTVSLVQYFLTAESPRLFFSAFIYLPVIEGVCLFLEIPPVFQNMHVLGFWALVFEGCV